jgi:hypothetical protein
VSAARAAREERYRRIEAYTPFPVEELAEALRLPARGVSLCCLLGGISGGAIAYGMQWYSAVMDYPLNVGGRPPHSWPAFVPLLFELTVLGAALSAVGAMLLLNGLPRLHHPIFETPHFKERNASHCYLCIEATDPKFDADATRRFLESLQPTNVWEVRDEE